MTIQDFITKTRSDWEATYRSRGAAEVLVGKMPDIKWADTLRNAGYHSVRISMSRWTDVHPWCNENFGEEHYTWTGTSFWFETEQDAILFALKWS